MGGPARIEAVAAYCVTAGRPKSARSALSAASVAAKSRVISVPSELSMSATTAESAVTIVRASIAACPVSPIRRMPLSNVVIGPISGSNCDVSVAPFGYLALRTMTSAL